MFGTMEATPQQDSWEKLAADLEDAVERARRFRESSPLWRQSRREERSAAFDAGAELDAMAQRRFEVLSLALGGSDAEDADGSDGNSTDPASNLRGLTDELVGELAEAEAFVAENVVCTR